MKSTVLFVTLLVVALATVGIGTAAAQGAVPPSGPGPRAADGSGPLHPFIVDALADALQLDSETISARLAGGETMRDIALAEGIEAAELPDFLRSVHETALATAVEAGVITQSQAAFFGRRMQAGARAFNGTGDCPMGGAGAFGSQAGMMRGRAWQGQ